MLDGRLGWTVRGSVAEFRRDGADWVGRVAEVGGEARASRQWLAVIVRNGVAVFTQQIIDPIAAAEWVERHRLGPLGGRRANG